MIHIELTLSALLSALVVIVVWQETCCKICLYFIECVFLVVFSQFQILTAKRLTDNSFVIFQFLNDNLNHKVVSHKSVYKLCIKMTWIHSFYYLHHFFLSCRSICIMIRGFSHVALVELFCHKHVTLRKLDATFLFPNTLEMRPIRSQCTMKVI